MKVLTGTQMADVDKKAIHDLGIDGLILMENAGIKIFQRIKEIIKDLTEKDNMPFSYVLIIAGKGNNGGDGFVIARHLLSEGYSVKVYAIAEESEYKGDALKTYKALKNFCEITTITEEIKDELENDIQEASIVVDALLGTGFKGPVKGFYYDVIGLINESDGIVFSVDIPSGVEADTGKVNNIAVEADYTETLAAPKLGLLVMPGTEYTGELGISDIGIPDYLIRQSKSNVYLTTDDYICDLMPIRVDESNKGTYGKVLTIAGSYTMTGAALLTSYSSLKIGSGMSILACPGSMVPYYAGIYPELTYVALPETSAKTIASSASSMLIDKLESYDVVAIGPGIGVDDETKRLVSDICIEAKNKDIPLVIDADGLNCLAELKGVKLFNNAILTPHPKELSRLLDVSLDDVLADRLSMANKAADRFGCSVVLKGSKTLIVSKDAVFINPTSTSALATAGTGDVLTGMIAGLVAQGLSVYDAAVCAVYIHGLAGELAAKKLTEYSVVASDVMNCIPEALIELGVL